MVDEKDRLGDKLHDVEKAREDQWARQHDLELLEKLRTKVAGGQLLCPHCNKPLVARQESGISLMTCPTGEGGWLSKGPLNTVLGILKGARQKLS